MSLSSHSSGFHLAASHCCDESVGLSPAGMCPYARASRSPRARQGDAAPRS